MEKQTYMPIQGQEFNLYARLRTQLAMRNVNLHQRKQDKYISLHKANVSLSQ